MFTRDDVVRVARKFEGTKWRHQGRLAGVGCDCVGLIIATGWDLGLWPGEDYSKYKRAPALGEMQKLCKRFLVTAPVGDRLHGQVALINYGGMPCHLAILTDKYEPRGMVHAFWRNREVCETRLTEEARRGIVRTYDFPEVSDG